MSMLFILELSNRDVDNYEYFYIKKHTKQNTKVQEKCVFYKKGCLVRLAVCL